MIWLTRLTLDPRDARVRSDLRSTYCLHKRAYSGLPVGPDGPGRVLYRLDYDRSGGNPVLLVQSDEEPDWSGLGGWARRVEVKAFSPTFHASQRLRFRLRANPTKRVPSPVLEGAGSTGRAEKKNNPRRGLIREEDQVAWLVRKGSVGGFRLEESRLEGRSAADPTQVVTILRPGVDAFTEGVDRPRSDDFLKGGLLAVRFEGVLVVEDAEAFSRTVGDGVGSAKGFGFGLLSVAPAG